MRGFVWGLEHVGDKGEEGDLEPGLCVNPGESRWGDEGRLCFQYDSQELMMLGFVCKEKRGVKNALPGFGLGEAKLQTRHMSWGKWGEAGFSSQVGDMLVSACQQPACGWAGPAGPDCGNKAPSAVRAGSFGKDKVS